MICRAAGLLHRRSGIDGPAANPAAGGGRRKLGEVAGQRHLGAQVLQGHPVLAGGVDQGRRQLADLRRVADDRDEMLGEPAVHADAELRLGLGQALVAVEQQLLVTGQAGLVPGQDTLQGQVR